MNMDPQAEADLRHHMADWPSFFGTTWRARTEGARPVLLNRAKTAWAPTTGRSVARSPWTREDGSVYFSTGDGAIHRYRYDRDAVETVAGDNLRKDYFGQYDVTLPATWLTTGGRRSGTRRTQVYGVHGNSGYLFRFDPRTERVEVLDRITSEPSHRDGMFDQFSYGYLGFALGPDRTDHLLSHRRADLSRTVSGCG